MWLVVVVTAFLLITDMTWQTQQTFDRKVLEKSSYDISGIQEYSIHFFFNEYFPKI